MAAGYYEVTRGTWAHLGLRWPCAPIEDILKEVRPDFHHAFDMALAAKHVEVHPAVGGAALLPHGLGGRRPASARAAGGPLPLDASRDSAAQYAGLRLHRSPAGRRSSPPSDEAADPVRARPGGGGRTSPRAAPASPVWAAPEKTASATRTEAAERADALFWSTLHAGDYEGIPRALTALTAAYLADPRDPVTAAHVGWLHIWRLVERARLDPAPPGITDHAVLSRKYFEEAVRLRPGEARYLGFYASALLAEGSIHKDEKVTRRGLLHPPGLRPRLPGVQSLHRGLHHVRPGLGQRHLSRRPGAHVAQHGGLHRRERGSRES